MADWKKIILENDAAALANVTSSGTLTLTSVADGDSTQNVLTIDSSGVVHSILQSSVDGTDTTYDAGTGLNLDSNNTFSVVPGEISHNALADHDALEHILWGSSNATYNIDPANYTNNTYTNGQGIGITNNGTESDTFYTLANQSHVTQVGALQAGSIVSGFGGIFTTGNIWTTGTLSGSSVIAGGNATIGGNATVGGTLTVANVTASNVGITGSLTVDGSLIFNGETFAEVIADTMTGSTSWGTDSDSEHYFTGSVTASGTISASAFYGSGAGLTGIAPAQLNLYNLAAVSGLQLSGAYNGTTGQSISIKNDTTGNDTIKLSGAGLRIKDGGVDTDQLAPGAVTTAKIAAGAVTGQKLESGIISSFGNVTPGSVAASNELLLSSGSAGNEVLTAMTIQQLATYVDSIYSYTDNTGSVTSVTATGGTDGLSLGLQAGSNSTTTPVIELSGTISIDDDNWTDGEALAIGNGGTGATSAAAAATALMNQNLGGNFIIGDSNDTIIIQGNLTVLGGSTNINSTNLEITDRFILIGSGSSATDTGIQFGETAGKSNLLFWDSSYGGGSLGGSANDGRFAVGTNQVDVAQDGVVDATATAAFHLASVYEGSLEAAGIANADHIGNIRIEGTSAYIYA
jgi:hypothetical protein